MECLLAYRYTDEMITCIAIHSQVESQFAGGTLSELKSVADFNVLIYRIISVT